MQNKPLADRMRPESFDEIAGQEHLVGKNGILRKLTDNGRIPNMIFFGPPGTGKTTFLPSMYALFINSSVSVSFPNERYTIMHFEVLYNSVPRKASCACLLFS